MLDTNTGAVVRGTWGAGVPASLTAAAVGDGWWKVTMSVVPPAGSANAHVFLDPPTANGSGQRSGQVSGLTATHYDPGMVLSSSIG